MHITNSNFDSRAVFYCTGYLELWGEGREGKDREDLGSAKRENTDYFDLTADICSLDLSSAAVSVRP